MQDEQVDIAVIGAGAAGLFAGIWAGRAAQQAGKNPRIVALDGARTLGAKILVAGGGRCNVTHHAVDESAYAGSSRNAIKKVLRGFGVDRTVEFFRDLHVELKREETGKLFPVTDSARTVLDALLRASRTAGVEVRHPWRVESVERETSGEAAGAGGFIVRPASEDHRPIAARVVILATGGKALPKSGSDGHGYTIARGLGHTVSERVFPALVPLVVDPARTFVTELSGVSFVATLEVVSGSGKRLAAFENSVLCTHFGLSGPGALDVSRYWTDARASDPATRLRMSLLPGMSFERVDTALAAGGKSSIARAIGEIDPARALPERLVRGLCEWLKIDPATPRHALTREQRRTLAHALTGLELPVTGDRGFTHAEVTAGGVPLSEVHLDTMESRVCPGLHLCGEILDVDGRIGGFNFQWAWASGYAAGRGAACGLT